MEDNENEDGASVLLRRVEMRNTATVQSELIRMHKKISELEDHIDQQNNAIATLIEQIGQVQALAFGQKAIMAGHGPTALRADGD